MMHVYCGDGKGKTTAAVGLALRAAGSGKRIIFAQFMKGNDSGEVSAMKTVPAITVWQNDKNYGFYHQMSEADKREITREHNRMLDRILNSINKKECDMLILDEFTYPYAYDLIDKEKAELLIKDRTEALELIITGRNPDCLFTEQADYITEMKCIRHPYEKGVGARKGVEY